MDIIDLGEMLLPDDLSDEELEKEVQTWLSCSSGKVDSCSDNYDY